MSDYLTGCDVMGAVAVRRTTTTTTTTAAPLATRSPIQTRQQTTAQQAGGAYSYLQTRATQPAGGITQQPQQQQPPPPAQTVPIPPPAQMAAPPVSPPPPAPSSVTPIAVSPPFGFTLDPVTHQWTDARGDVWDPTTGQVTASAGAGGGGGGGDGGGGGGGGDGLDDGGGDDGGGDFGPDDGGDGGDGGDADLQQAADQSAASDAIPSATDDDASAFSDAEVEQIVGEVLGVVRAQPRRRAEMKMSDYLFGCDVLSCTILGDETIPSAGVTYTDHDTVLAVQTALKAKGIDPGPLDGILGPKTIAAIKKIPGATGVIDYGVLSALGVSAPSRSSSLPSDGRPAAGWSQPQPGQMGPAVTPESAPWPLWKKALVGGLAGMAAIGVVGGIAASRHRVVYR